MFRLVVWSKDKSDQKGQVGSIALEYVLVSAFAAVSGLAAISYVAAILDAKTSQVEQATGVEFDSESLGIWGSE